ncbi:zinc ribbon domain-containing protein, partial [Actinomadura sp. CNU-125]|uniref:zinc ribbon domain-containing protein n=1 Tax=Actinomadura sp. CNU-125 TaxID=1904961 RepID=UPI00117756A6
SCCGHVLEHLSLSARCWTCPGCRTRHDRDVNAAGHAAAGRLSPGDVCGADVRRPGNPRRRRHRSRNTYGASRKLARPNGKRRS